MARFAFTVALHKVNSKTGKETTHDHKKLESLYNVKGKVVKHDATIYLIRRGMSSLKREYEEDSFLFKRRFSPSEFKDFRTNVVVMAKMTDGSTKVYHEFEDAHTQPSVAFNYIDDLKRCFMMKDVFESGIECLYVTVKPTGSDERIQIGKQTVVGVSSFSTSEKPECKLSEFVNEEFFVAINEFKKESSKRFHPDYFGETMKTVSTPYGNFNATVNVYNREKAEDDERNNVSTYRAVAYTSNDKESIKLDAKTIESEVTYYEINDRKRVKINCD